MELQTVVIIVGIIISIAVIYYLISKAIKFAVSLFLLLLLIGGLLYIVDHNAGTDLTGATIAITQNIGESKLYNQSKQYVKEQIKHAVKGIFKFTKKIIIESLEGD